MSDSSCVSVLFFFCKQKTAYEMRISDWSSDVCSSDLFGLVNGPREKYRASLITTEKFFCIAGVFHPGHRDWPPCFAALTVAAYPDLEPYKDRHVAIVHPDDWWDWLDKERDPLDILKPFPDGSFRVIGPPVQQGLSL